LRESFILCRKIDDKTNSEPLFHASLKALV
jgi:hypothetical protein